MKTYDLIRDVDDSGVSGTEKVAEACVFSNGRCVVAWVGTEKTGIQSIVVYDSLEDAETIHGHDGHTRFVEVASERDGWPTHQSKQSGADGDEDLIFNLVSRQMESNFWDPRFPPDPSKQIGIPNDPADT